MLEKDKELQKIFWQLLLADPRIWFSAVCWTLNPRREAGYRNIPFILRPKQEEFVLKLHNCVTNQRDFGGNKSRDEGATEIITKYIALMAATCRDSYFIVGSRNKNLVDNVGDPYTLMAKIDHAYACAPTWMCLQKDVDIERKDMQLRIPRTNSVIEGETTNENFSTGRRATAIFLDEFGRVDPAIAESIEGSVHDVTGCVIYCSTHWYGSEHAFNKALRRPTTTVVSLPWYENPVKTVGLYETPEINKIVIKDIQYYRNICPEIFNSIKENEVIVYSDFEGMCLSQSEDIQEKLQDITFVADGGTNLPSGFFVRSPWHDFEERRRSRRDFMANIWMDPQGASDAVFSPRVLDRVEELFAKPAKYRGEIKWFLSDYDKVTNPVFVTNSNIKNLEIWCDLINGKPTQLHNYIIGCDISMGTGASNSTAAIYDTNNCELIGMLATPTMPPHIFADAVVALARWVGGSTSEAFVIWENNGGQGLNFEKRVLWNGYTRVYTGRKEDGKIRSFTNSYGWHSTRDSKDQLLGELSVALTESLRPGSKYKKITIHDKNLIDELRSYVYTEGIGTCPGNVLDQSSGARERHGDRVIAAGLCVLATRDQYRSIMTEPLYKPEHCIGQRIEAQRIEQAKERQYFRHFMY